MERHRVKKINILRKFTPARRANKAASRIMRKLFVYNILDQIIAKTSIDPQKMECGPAFLINLCCVYMSNLLYSAGVSIKMSFTSNKSHHHIWKFTDGLGRPHPSSLGPTVCSRRLKFSPREYPAGFSAFRAFFGIFFKCLKITTFKRYLFNVFARNMAGNKNKRRSECSLTNTRF